MSDQESDQPRAAALEGTIALDRVAALIASLRGVAGITVDVDITVVIRTPPARGAAQPGKSDDV